jgi:hypothetical protein
MKRLVLTSVAFSFLASSAFAAPPPNPKELAKDRAAIKEGHRELVGDRWDAIRLQALADAYRKAAAKPTKAKIAELDAQFIAEMRLELRETNNETAEKAAEVRQSKAEVNKERRQLGKSVVKGQPVRAVKNSIELADDKRDLHKRFAALRGKNAPAPVAQKLAIIEEALTLARAEVKTDVKEIREDRREFREDVSPLR